MQCSPVLVKAQTAEAAAFAAAAALRDLSALSDAEVLQIYETMTRVEHAAASAKLLLTGRIDRSGEAARQGAPSTAELLAKKSGTSVGAAKSDLDAAKALEGLDETTEAMLNGEVSPEQAKVVAGAARKNPKAQRRLLDKAKSGSHKELQEEAQRVRAENDTDPEAAHRRIHAKRHVTDWVDEEGVWNLRAQGTPVDGARMMAAIRREADRIFRERASATDREPRGAYAFDAMTGLITRREDAGDGTAPRQPAPEHLAILRLDVAALRREAVGDGELCEIVGVGPIPVTVAKRLLGDAVLKLVITNGVDVLNVTSLTRRRTQAMHYATLWTSPGCTVAGCDRTICEYDHVNGAEYKDTRHTRLDELEPVCTNHHDLHTRKGWALVRGKGKRPMVPPGHPDHPTQPGTRGDPPPAWTEQDRAGIAEQIRLARHAVGARLNGREPPDPRRGPAPPEPAGATPSLFG